MCYEKLSLDEILQSVGVLSVVASVMFVGLELRQGNLLAQMKASDRTCQGSSASVGVIGRVNSAELEKTATTSLELPSNTSIGRL